MKLINKLIRNHVDKQGHTEAPSTRTRVFSKPATFVATVWPFVRTQTQYQDTETKPFCKPFCQGEDFHKLRLQYCRTAGETGDFALCRFFKLLIGQHGLTVRVKSLPFALASS